MSTPALSQRSDMVVFFNGEYIPADQAKVGVMTHALAYGTGVFEGLRGYWNDEKHETYIFRAREHFERMHRSCRIMSIELPYSVDDLVEIAVQLVRRNGLRENCYIRPFAYKADEDIGVRLHGCVDRFTMYAVPTGDYVKTTGLKCGVSSWRRVDDNMIPARAKVAGAYVNSALAKTEAVRNGYDEAIFLTSEGHVCEGSAENLFMLINKELVTPPPSENILLGVTRDTIIELAGHYLEMPVRERQIDRTELYCADEIFLTGTGAQIAPVVEVDRRTVGTGAIGPVSKELMRLYHEIVRGKRPQYMDWCTPVFGGASQTAATPGAKAASNGHKKTTSRARRETAGTAKK